MSKNEEDEEECDDVELIKEVIEKLIEAKRKIAEAASCVDTNNHFDVYDMLVNVRFSILTLIDALTLVSNRNYRVKIRTDPLKTKVWKELV